MVKSCVFRLCKSREKSKKPELREVSFYPLPKPSRDIERCKLWLQAINRKDLSPESVAGHHFVCSKHFIGRSGPTQTNPYPISDDFMMDLQNGLSQDVINTETGNLENGDEVMDGPLESSQHCLGRVIAHSTNKQIPTEVTNRNSEQDDVEFVGVLDSSNMNSLKSNRVITRTIIKRTSTKMTTSSLGHGNQVFSIPVESCSKKVVTCTTSKGTSGNSEQVNEMFPDSMESSTKHLQHSTFEDTVVENRTESFDERREKSQTTDKVDSLNNLAKHFLMYQAEHLNTMLWCFQIDEQNESGITKVSFKKTFGSCSLTFQVSLLMIGSIVSYQHTGISSTENDFISTLEVDLQKPISSLPDLLDILSRIEECVVCQGIRGELYSFFKDKFLKSSYHCQLTQSLRSNKCHTIFKKSKASLCQSCRLTKRILQNRIVRTKKQVSTSPRMNLRFLDKHQLIQRTRALNLKNKALKRRIKLLEIKVKKSINKEGVWLSPEESADLEETLKKNPFQDKSTFQKLFLREQLKILSSKKSRPKKWHPAIIAWCVYMRAKSPTTYRAMSQALSLPSSSTLFNYSRYLTAKSGFNEEVLVEMREKINFETLKEHQKYFSLILDEIQIKEDLVFNSNTGELIGFQNLNEFRNKVKEVENRINGEETVESQLPLANHVLQLMVRGLTTKFKYPFAFFPCKKMNADDLYSIVWQAIKHLQGAGFNILTVVCDKAATNQKLIKMSTLKEKEKNGDKVGYRTVNIHNNGEPVFFISDICHLIKTTRNCLNNSGRRKKQKDGSLKYIRLMSKNGKHLLWEHFVKMVNTEISGKFRRAPKLTYSHINMTPFNAMRVKLATQLLSSTVANAMEDIIGESASETVKFIRLFDTFFDILNVSNLLEGKQKRKPALDPFRKLDDWRFKWLEEEFLSYFDEWESEVAHVDVGEDFDREKLMLSKETLEGLRITVYSSIAAIKYLLNKGSDFVLSSKFNQDPLELYFGKHRAAIGSGENPTINQYHQSVKRLKCIGSIALAPKTGNCSVKRKRVTRRKDARKRVRI